jgi:hypothetical protein
MALTDALRLYVLWAPGSPGVVPAGARLARAFGERLDAVGMVRDGVGLRIPVRQRSVAWRPDVDSVAPRKIDLDGSRSNIVVAVYDDVMAARPGWTQYLNDIQAQASKRGARDLLIMVLMTSNKAAPNAWSEIQAIRAPAPVLADWDGWLRRVMLDILALSVDRGVVETAGLPKKIRVFLSHAKADGENAALLIEGFKRLKPDQQQVNSIEMFFDSSDTLAGARYDAQFRSAIEQGVFLALVTDAYHTRRWCQWELLLAKERQRPIVIWDRSQKGILRSFPYFGNVPVVRASNVDSKDPPQDAEIELLLLALLLEALRILVWKDFASDRLASRPDLTPDKVVLFARPPELTDMAYHRRAKGAPIVIYPDPPIGQDERELLLAANPDVQLLALSEAVQ